MDLESGFQFGDFLIERRIGAGGMGVVYLARQVSLDRPVALKVLGSALDRDSDIARFRREAQAIAKLHHPGIASVYFVGQDGHVCYIAMEFIDGESLRVVIERLKRLRDPAGSLDAVLGSDSSKEETAPVIRFDVPTLTPPPDMVAEQNEARGDPESPTPEARRMMSSQTFIRLCCGIVRDAALALAHAHERGVVHRDIKPENILLDRQGKVHLIDFGIARFFEDVTLTNTGALIGTPMYMSPEQVTGRLTIDHRTDIYSLGLVLYELLTVQRPIEAPTREALLRQIVTKAMNPVSWRNRAVSRDLESVVHRAIAKDPDERYQATTDFVSDLRHVLAGEPVTATPYRYKLDEREIAAERPQAVIPVAFICFLLAVCFGVLGLMTYLIGSYFGSPAPSAEAVAYAILAPGSYLVGIGLLSGRRWAVRAAIVGCLILPGVGVPLVIWFLLRHATSTAPLLIGFVASSFIFPLLIPMLRCREVKDWVRYAERLRSEHQQQSASQD